MNRTPLAAIGLPLAFTIACGSGSEEPEDRLVQTCELPDQAAAVTWFGADGSLHWTSDAIAEDGSMTVRYCDSDVARATRITGLTAGDEIDWQGGAMTDGERRVIHVADITTTVSNTPVASPRLGNNVTIQCIPLLGSCAPVATEEDVEVPESEETTTDSKPAGS